METAAPKSRTRKGTETRQRQRRVTYRMNVAEYIALEAAALAAGLTVASYTRARVLAAPTTRARRRPSVEVLALTRLQGELNRIGSNIHQLLRHVNFGGLPDAEEARAAFAGYREAIGAILEALGRTPR